MVETTTGDIKRRLGGLWETVHFDVLQVLRNFKGKFYRGTSKNLGKLGAEISQIMDEVL